MSTSFTFEQYSQKCNVMYLSLKVLIKFQFVTSPIHCKLDVRVMFVQRTYLDGITMSQIESNIALKRASFVVILFLSIKEEFEILRKISWRGAASQIAGLQ